MSGDTVLVTGGTGFLGLEVVRLLVRQGHDVVALARGRSPGGRELRAMAEQGLIRWIVADLTRPDLGLSGRDHAELEGSVRAVIHAAGHYRLSGARADVQATNVAGTRHLLGKLSAWGVASFHHVSSVGGAGDADGWVPEQPLERPRRFRNCYEESKWESEQLVLSGCPVPARIYRPGIIVGHSRTGEIPKLDGPYAAFGMMRRGIPFPIPGAGDRPFQLVNVDLVAEALVAGLSVAPSEGDVFHVLDGDPPTVREFAETMSRRIAGHGWVLGLPPRLALAAAQLPGFGRISGLEAEAVEYMVPRWDLDTKRFAEFCVSFGIDTCRVKRALDSLAVYYSMSTRRRVFPPA